MQLFFLFYLLRVYSCTPAKEKRTIEGGTATRGIPVPIHLIAAKPTILEDTVSISEALFE